MRGVVVSIVLIVVGVVIAAVGGGRVGFEAAGLVVAGIGGVIGVSAAFWIIGRSEDRDRGKG